MSQVFTWRKRRSSRERFEHLINVYLTHADTLSLYAPEPYIGPVQLYRATMHGEGGERDPDPAWLTLLPNLTQEYHLPGDHYEILRYKGVSTLAVHMRELLENYTPAALLAAQGSRIKPSQTNKASKR